MTLTSPVLSAQPVKINTMSEKAFQRVREIAREEAGLAIPDTKKSMVQSRLARRLKALGLVAFENYLDLVESVRGKTERTHMITALTTNVSHFFREDHHFKTLRDDLIPGFATRLRSGEPIRIWSAGCSTGQEPYSIAMTLLEHIPELHRYDLRILATDIDRPVLDRALEGVYSESQISGVPEALLRKYFSAHDDSWRVGAELREFITFRELNLMRDWPMRRRFDAVFCRNVVIYFDTETQGTLWPRFANALHPGGWLFLGHSERLDDAASAWFSSAGVTTYRRNQSSLTSN